MMVKIMFAHLNYSDRCEGDMDYCDPDGLAPCNSHQNAHSGNPRQISIIILRDLDTLIVIFCYICYVFSFKI